MIHHHVFVFNFLILSSSWVVAASLMAEKTNVGIIIIMAEMAVV